MSTTARANRLIESLPGKERYGILGHCEPVDLVAGTILCEPGQLLKYAYFPLTSFILLAERVEKHAALGIRLIGNEGMLGATLVLGISTAPTESVVQGAGSALRMTTRQLGHDLAKSPALRRTLQRYVYVLMAQLTQNTACGHFHEVEARLARWLLLTHDRAHADHFHLTHQVLADMLGVQRSAVTIAAGDLQRRALIRYSRGQIQVLDRNGLEAASCECYAAVLDHYDEFFD